MPEKKGTPEKVKVNQFTHLSCRMHPSPSHSPPIPFNPPPFGKRPKNISRLENFFSHATPSPQIQFPSYGRALSILSDIEGSIELRKIFYWVLGWWSCDSHIKQRVSFRAVNCVKDKPLPLQLEF